MLTKKASQDKPVGRFFSQKNKGMEPAFGPSQCFVLRYFALAAHNQTLYVVVAIRTQVEEIHARG